MTDIKLDYKSEEGRIGFDVELENGDLVMEPGIQSAILVSLFTDRRAEKDEFLPSEGIGRRGWWGDVYAGDKGHRIGSKLWLHSREKVTVEVLARVEDEIRNALQWLIDNGFAMKIEVEVEAQSTSPENKLLAIRVVVYRRDGTRVAENYQYMWSD